MDSGTPLAVQKEDRRSIHKSLLAKDPHHLKDKTYARARGQSWGIWTQEKTDDKSCTLEENDDDDDDDSDEVLSRRSSSICIFTGGTPASPLSSYSLLYTL